MIEPAADASEIAAARAVQSPWPSSASCPAARRWWKTLRRLAVLIALLVVLDAHVVEAQCSYSVSPAMVAAPSTGLSSSISVVTGSACAWTANSLVPWITVTSGGLSGLGSVSYSVAANDTGVARSGAMTVAGQMVTVTQATGSCSYSVSPTAVTAPATGSVGSVSVVTGSLCSWTATSAVPWIAITNSGTSGIGSAGYTVAATATPRSGTITVAGRVVTITQGGAQSAPPAPPVNLRILLVI